MKRAICLFLAIFILCSSAVTVAASGVTNSDSDSNYLLGLQSYLKTDNDEYLLRNENYAYWLLIEDFESDIVMWEILNAIDLYIGCGTEPDVYKFTEVLVNIIATYDCDNASDIAEQHKNDNMKSALDYAMDIAQIGANSVDLMVGMDKSASDLEEWISIAVSGLSTMAGNVDNWIDALSDLETLVQNYTSYDAFLALIEKKSSGDLKAAASSLRTSMKTAMQMKLDTYSDVLDKNFENYTEFFFTDVFFDALKLSAEYDSDEDFKVLVDCGNNFADKVKEFFLNPKKAWDLGIAIGTLVGNVAVDGEDVINRLHELMALRDIGNILCGELQEIESFYNSGDYDNNVAQRYFELSNYLIGCRLRGEYCRYSIIASDSGLLSKLSFKKAEEAEIWYQNKSERIMEIRKAIKTACNAILVHIKTDGYEVGELSEWYVYDVNGSLCHNYTLRITSKEKMHIGAIVADDFTQPIEYVVTTPEPLLLDLDPGYWYTFEVQDNADAENTLFFTVAVNPSSEGLIEMIEIQTVFTANSFAVNDNGTVFLTERPSADRPGLFTFKEFDLEGYAYETERGGYTIESFSPSNLNLVANFVGDFTHSGKHTNLTVQKVWSDYSCAEKLCLQIEGVINAYVNDLSLYDDKEIYYYIVDGIDTAYLVCEKVEYDNFSASNGKYYYKTGSDSGKDITESITIINMSNYTTHTFTVDYNTEYLYASYTEEIKEFMGDSKTNYLFYVGYSNEGQFSNYADVVAYITSALSPYGLADRVLSNSSSLSNYTPVYTTTVIGEPKSGSVEDYADAQIRGKGIVGFPTYTGTWFPDGIVKEPVTPSEDNSVGGDQS